MHERAGLLPAPLPKWLAPLLSRLETDTGLFAPDTPLNHVLVRIRSTLSPWQPAWHPCRGYSTAHARR